MSYIIWYVDNTCTVYIYTYAYVRVGIINVIHNVHMTYGGKYKGRGGEAERDPGKGNQIKSEINQRMYVYVFS